MNRLCFLLLLFSSTNGCNKATEPQIIEQLQAGFTDTVKTYYTHDFGIVRPHTTHEHRFEVHNPTDSIWTVQTVRSSCVCTIPSMSARQISPGKTESFTVSYKAASLSELDSRSTSLLFTDSNIPEFHFVVTARVLEELRLSQKSFQSKVNRGESTEIPVTISNTTEESWDEIIAESNAEWLTTMIAPVSTQSNTDSAVKEWRLLMKLDSHQLHTGTHRAAISVWPKPSSQERKREIVVEMLVTGPCSITPQRLHLGSLLPGEIASANCLLHVAIDRDMADSDVVVECMDENCMKVSPSIKTVSKTVKKISLQFTMPDTAGYKSSTLRVRILGFPEEEFIIPVNAKVVEK